MSISRAALSSIAAACALAACSSAPQQTEQTSSTSERIIHGHASDDSQDAVVLIEQVTMGYGCSGTLLAPNLVLTARHCVSNLVSEGVQCDVNGNGTSASAIGADFVPGTLFIYTGKTRPAGFGSNPAAKGMKIIHDNATNLCNHDLALILLDRKIDGAQISPIRLDGPPVKTDTVTAVGWGVSETTAMPPARLQRNGIKIAAIGPAASGFLPTPPHNFMVGEAFCQGDSGGPGYAESTGAVIGVVSYGGNGSGNTSVPWGNCIDTGSGVYNFYTRVDAFKDTILGAYQQAGQDPWLEGGPDPRLAVFGDPCGAGSDCRSNLCWTDPKSGNGACTQDCSADACPDGYDCAKNKDLGQICVPHASQSTSNNNGTTTTKSGCAASPQGDASPIAWGALAALSLAFARRRRATASRR